MPKVSKIKVVDLENAGEEVATVVEVEAVEAVAPVEAVETVAPVDAVEAVAPVEAVVMKTKPKARAKAKSAPIPVLEPVKEEPPVEEVKPIVKELTPCPRCGKKLTEKGLRYSHKCPADKVLKTEQAVSIIERIIEKEPIIIKEEADYNNIPEEILQNEIRKIMSNAREHRALRQKENMKRLAVNIV